MSSPATGALPSPSSALRRERDRFVGFAFTWADILIELDHEQRITYATGALENLIGRNVKDLLGTEFHNLVLPWERAKARTLLASVSRCERTEGATLSLIGPNGQAANFAFSGYRLLELEGHIFIALRGRPPRLRDEHAACRDRASGLLKHDSFSESVRQLFSESKAETKQRLSLIRVLGSGQLRQEPEFPPERDLLLSIGECLRSRSTDGDLATRVGPDRFGLLHSAEVDIGDLKQALLDLVAATEPYPREPLIESATFEICSKALRTEEIARGIVYIINRYRASDQGASDLCTASQSRSFTQLAEEAVRAIDKLGETITRGDYGLVFQPIIDALSGEIHHYEALARFPRRRELCGTTGEYIMLAEEIGMITEFDCGILKKAYEHLGGPAIGHQTKIAVNVSGQSVNSAAYTACIDDLVNVNAWLKDRLMFEITESTRIKDLLAANQFVLKLRSGGYTVCLDDFGAGASNFQYLASLDVDIVKLDGAAVECARGTAKGMAFLKMLVGLCRELSIATVVEMVDSPASLHFARACGAEYVQGYLFGKPHADIAVFERVMPRNLFCQATKFSSKISRVRK